MQIDPYANDPGRWAHSLIHHSEVLLPCLDTAGARSVVEVGAYAGDLTAPADGLGCELRRARDRPSTRRRRTSLVELAEANEELELIRETSLDALQHIELPDAVVIDGDHNYYTVSEELRLIDERAGSELPLLLFHDVLLAARAAGRLLRARTDPRGPPPADRGGRRTVPRRGGNPARRTALPRGGGTRGRPAERRAHRRRGLRRGTRRPAARGSARVLRAWRGLAPRRALG